jgi:hypothetical protein
MTSLRATRSFCLHSTRAIGLGQHHLLRIAADDARHVAKATGTLTNHTCTMLLPTIQLGGIGALAAADNRRTTTPFSTNSSVPVRPSSTQHTPCATVGLGGGKHLRLHLVYRVRRHAADAT